MHRHEMTEEQWERLAGLLPARKGTGRPRNDDRQIINGILWLLRTGAPWRDLPERYGPWRTVATRFYRWQKAGVWQQVLSAVQEASDQAGGVDGKCTTSMGPSFERTSTQLVQKGGPIHRGIRPLSWRLQHQDPPALRRERQADGHPA